MAYYAALSSLVQLLDDIILHDRYPTFVLRKHPVVKSLHQKFTSLEESLQDYSSNGDEVNDCFEGRMRDVAYRAQDIIEIEISNHICFMGSKFNNVEGVQVGEQETRSIEEEIQMVEQETSSTVEELDTVEEETNSIIEELRMVEQETDSILKEMMAIKERHTSEDSKLIWDSPASIQAVEQAPAAKNIMVGLDEDLIIIKDQVCGQSSQLKVVPIVGMGGIGKTTLARNSFDDALVATHFDCRVWVTLSQDYNENKVLQIISDSLESLMKELPVGGDSKERIYKCLKGRRYLVVVDDIWSTKAWDDLKRIFPNDCNRSRIMLTTRLLDVARYAVSQSDFVHEMQLLNKENSWNLLQKKIFAEECCPAELKNIGELIASKCCGLPLAVVVIAGVLSNLRTLHHWEKIARKVSTILSTSDEQMNRILSLSYYHLPHQLKACFLYLGGFPEDYEINISNLVRLWIADGLLKSNDSSKILEMVGEECLEDLVKRNLVLISRKRPNGQFKTCMLHDLVRDFCRQRAFSEFFFHVEDVEGHLYPMEIEKIRRLNYYNVLDDGECRQTNIGKLARSVNFYTGGWDRIEFSREFAWDDVKLLRVLYPSIAMSSSYRDMPEEIFQLLYLKYFRYCMSTCFNAGILSSMFELQNLQTLIFIAMESESIILPPQIWQMTQLRHLIINGLMGMMLPSIPLVSGRIPIQKLECLQTLMTVVDCGFSNEVIQMIPNLRKLKVTGMETDINNLVHLPHLEELKIREHRITSSLSFPSNLQKLSLSYCYIPWPDMTMVGSLPNLQVLKLGRDSFVGEEWNPIEREFPRLKFLQFWGLKLKYWRAENAHFPRLEYLRILYCDDLEMIPLEIGDILTLKVIEVTDSDSAGNSAINIQEEQREMGNDALQVLIYDRYTGAGPTYMEVSRG